MRIKPNCGQCITRAKNKDTFLAQGADANNPNAKGIALSAEWRVLLNGEELIVYSVPVTRGGPHSFAVANIKGYTDEITVSYHAPLRNAKVMSAGKLPKYKVSGQKISMCQLEIGSNLLIEVNDNYREPLSLFIAAQDEVPDTMDTNVLWFEPGIHRLSYLELNDEQTLYLESGAIIIAEPVQPDEMPMLQTDWAAKPNYKDFIYAENKKNITVCGNGIIDTSELDWHARRTMVFTSCENISISGVIMNGASHWTMPFFGCKNVHVDNIKIIGYRENSDGINLVDCQNASVENCFIRTGDDAVCIKSMGLTEQKGSRSIDIRRCLIWNDKVRALGIAGETRHDIYDVVFEDCLIVHSFADWTREVGSLCIIVCDKGCIHDIAFRRIEILHEANYAINCIIMKDKWSTDAAVGHINDIRFEDISIPKNSMLYLRGYDKDHKLERIHFERIRESDTHKEVKIYNYLEIHNHKK